MNVHIMILFLAHPLTFHGPKQTKRWNSNPQSRGDMTDLFLFHLCPQIVWWMTLLNKRELKNENNSTKHFEKNHSCISWTSISVSKHFWVLNISCIRFIYLLTYEIKSLCKLPIHFPSLETERKVIMVRGEFNWCKS